MKALFAKFLRLDWIQFGCMLALVALGIVFIHSAGAARPSAALRNLWLVHSLTAAVGLVVCLGFALVDYRKLLDWTALPVFIVSCTLLLAVLVFGEERFGGKRWLWFFQPSEIAKLAVIIFTAHVFAVPNRRSFKWLIAGLAILGGPALLILKEPDLGTALVLVPAVIAMLLAAQVWTKGLVTLLATGLLAAGLVLGTVYVAEREPVPEKRAQIYSHLPLRAHQIKRLRIFLFPDSDIHGAGYNLHQAEISIGSGSLWGKGIGKGEQKALGYLPPSVSMNDFIFAVLAEESGFAGSLCMLLLFLGTLLTGLRNAIRCMDDRGRLLATGILTLVFCHVYVNVAMSIGLVPITGLPLPFISAGRTFLIVLMAAFGLLQSICIHREDE